MDERFMMHRFYSSRLALVAGALALGIWFNYDWFVNRRLRLDLVAILAIMALAKVVAMIYYRLTR
jgi:hypothetical protein